MIPSFTVAFTEWTYQKLQEQKKHVPKFLLASFLLWFWEHHQKNFFFELPWQIAQKEIQFN